MAIDTREKRFSMLNFGDGTNLHALFEADGDVDQGDRLHHLDLYAFFTPPTNQVAPASMMSGVGFVGNVPV